MSERRLRIIVLMHERLLPPESIEGLSEKEIQPWKTEWDVVSALKKLGHEVFPVGLHYDLQVIKKAIEEYKPHIAFNLCEEFQGFGAFESHIVSYLELLGIKYTGCNPRGLMIAHDKALSKKILVYHRVQVPHFLVFPINKRIRKKVKVAFPLLVKSVSEEGSAGVSQASVVYNEDELVARVEFIHRQTQTHAIAEEFIAGRELYVGVYGNQQITTLPIWELSMNKLPEGSNNIATGKVKWDYRYQKKVGVETGLAKELDPVLTKKIHETSKKIFKLLDLTGYARLDYRLKENGDLYLLEANPNPNLSADEDFAASATLAGLNYPQLLEKMMQLGCNYRRIGVQ